MTEFGSIGTFDEYMQAVEDGDLEPPELMSWASWTARRKGATTTISEEVELRHRVMKEFHGPRWMIEVLAKAEAAGSGDLSRDGAVQFSGSRLGAGADGGSAAETVPERQSAARERTTTLEDGLGGLGGHPTPHGSGCGGLETPCDSSGKVSAHVSLAVGAEVSDALPKLPQHVAHSLSVFNSFAALACDDDDNDEDEECKQQELRDAACFSHSGALRLCSSAESADELIAGVGRPNPVWSYCGGSVSSQSLPTKAVISAACC